jgi:hypothetical protein
MRSLSINCIGSHDQDIFGSLDIICYNKISKRIFGLFSLKIYENIKAINFLTSIFSKMISIYLIKLPVFI